MMKRTILLFGTFIFISGLLLAAPLKSKAASYPNDTLIRAEGDPKVFVIHNNKKRWLRDEAIFNSYFFSWDAIKVLPPSTVNAIPYNNLISSDGVKVFVLNGLGHKRHILNPTVFDSYGFDWADIADINQTELDSYADTNLIRQTGDEKVYYLVQGNTKRWVKTAEAFEASDFGWELIQIVNEAEMSAYIAGEEITATEKEPDIKEAEEILPVDTQDPVFKALSKKIGEDDAKIVTVQLTKRGFVLTEEFIDKFITEYSPGYDADNDITIIGDPEAPYFLEIVKNSLDRFYNYSPEMYQYAISSLRYIRGVNFGTRCGGARTGYDRLGMEVNTYIWIYDYEGIPWNKQPLVYGFLFVHEATHNKNYELEQTGQIRKLTGYENEAIAYLAHAYYAKEYDPEGQDILAPRFGMTLKEFVMGQVFGCVEEPEDYVWDWDFYVAVLEKAGFPFKDLEKLKAYLAVTSIAPVVSNIQISNIPSPMLKYYSNVTPSAAKITWDTDKLAKTLKLEYSLNSDLSSATTITNGYFGGYGATHTYIFSNLSVGKTYYYRITSEDVSDNLSVSPIYHFTKTVPDIKHLGADSWDALISFVWNNPLDDEFAGVKIVRKVGSYPVDANDGVEVYNGANNHCNDPGLTNGVTYYYKVFAYDKALNYSPGVGISATPL